MLGNQIENKQIESKHEKKTLGIGRMLRELRMSLNLTLEQVAQKVGISEETVRRIELDQFEPKISTLEILSDFYRIDLIELISRKRGVHSVFSETFISQVNDFINKGEYVQLRLFADDVLRDLLSTKNPSKNALSTFLYSIKYLKYDPINGQNDTIAIVESILLEISPTYLNEEGFQYPLPIEVSCILLLSIMYRQNESYDKALQILKVTIKRIESMPLINDRYADYLASAYLNLAYTYHSLEAHDLVISTVDECFNHHQISFTKTVMSHLLFRKGLALYLIGEPLSISLIKTSLSLMDTKLSKHMTQVLMNKYTIDVSR